MYLKRLDIHGFKSFADRLTLNFNKGITAVVGPNGSGKSNVADSVRWVLGEQSAKTLRGSKMEDIIFAGTQSRRPLAFAEVSLTIDNGERKMPIDFTEVTVTRRVYRSGESEYFINHTGCRLKDIQELFMDTGVGKEGYSIIGQGQIDKILSTKPDERRFLFEEAVGIVKYKTRRKEAEKKLEQEKQNLIRIEDIIVELENQIEPLAVQAEKAKKYMEYTEDLKTIELNIFLEEADRLKDELEQNEEMLKSKSCDLAQEQKGHESVKEQQKQLKRNIDEMENQVDETIEKISSLKTFIEKSQGDNKVKETQIQHIQQDLERLENDCEKLFIQQDKKSEEKKCLDVKQNSIRMEAYSKHEILIDKEKQFQKLNQVLSDSEIEIENSKADIIEKLTLSSEMKSDIQRITAMFEQVEQRKNQIIQENKFALSQCSDQKIHLKVLQKEKHQLDEQDQVLKAEIEQLISMNASLNTEIEKKNKQIEQVNRQIHNIRSKYQLLSQMEKEREGFYKSVKTLLHLKEKDPQDWTGICGVIAELVTVPEGYETAIEVALGSSMQNIVTQSEKDAQQAIEHLKRNRLGRATFLPLSAIKGKNFGQERSMILKEEGILGIAAELIQYDAVYQKVINHLLGKVLIAKDLNYAIRITKKYHHRYKIVTLDGEILNPGGAMTGGSLLKKTNNIFARARQLETLKVDLEQLTYQLKKETYSLQEQEKKKQCNANEIENKKDRDQQIHLQLISNQHEIRQTEQAIKQLEERQTELSLEEKQLEEQYESIFKHMKEKKEELVKIENEIAQIQSKVENYQINIQTERDVKESLTEEITNIKIQLSSLEQEQKALQDNIDRLESEIQTFIEERKQRDVEIKKCKQEQLCKQEDIQNIKEQIQKYEEQLTQSQMKKEELQRIRKDYGVQLENSEKQLEELLQKSSLLQEDVHRIENIKTKVLLEQENLFNRMWEEYEATYQSAIKVKKELGKLPQMKKKAEGYKQQIKQLGNVNIDAMEEYEKVKQRYEFLSEQRNDLLEGEKKLRQIIQELTNSMKKQFAQQFELISKTFNVVFSELFGGGKGYLKLVDEDNILESGIDIIAQPPGKKLQNMMLLSGGERALTAIALLFSILKIKPSPFCILDEIEAALDDANVYRFAQYLKIFDDRTQFIVITHRKGTMEVADALYGVTMEEHGVSKLLSVKFSDEQVS